MVMLLVVSEAYDTGNSSVGSGLLVRCYLFKKLNKRIIPMPYETC